jgi:hypothetical protein
MRPKPNGLDRRCTFCKAGIRGSNPLGPIGRPTAAVALENVYRAATAVLPGWPDSVTAGVGGRRWVGGARSLKARGATSGEGCRMPQRRRPTPRARRRQAPTGADGGVGPGWRLATLAGGWQLLPARRPAPRRSHLAPQRFPGPVGLAGSGAAAAMSSTGRSRLPVRRFHE